MTDDYVDDVPALPDDVEELVDDPEPAQGGETDPEAEPESGIDPDA